MSIRPILSRPARAAAVLSLALAGLVGAFGVAPAYAAACARPESGIPQITSFTFTPTTVDVRSAARVVTITADASDTSTSGGTGIAGIDVVMGSPNLRDYATASLSRIAGTDFSGTWRGTTTIPRWVQTGTWKVISVTVTDGAENARFYGFDELTQNSWRRTLAVTSTEDVTAPTITGFTRSPSSVNTTSAVANVNVTLTAKDSQSGVSTVLVAFTAPSGTPRDAGFGIFTRTSGTGLNGVWKGKVSVGRWVSPASSTWTAGVVVFDAGQNRRAYFAAQLPASYRNLHVTSSPDTTKPAISALQLTPPTLNVTDTAATENISMHGTDTGSGITFILIKFTSQSGQTAYGYVSLVSGTKNNGNFSGSASFPQCSEPGYWTVTVTPYDYAFNTRPYSAAQLKAMSLPYRVLVQGPDVTGPALAVPATVPKANNVVATFSEDVKGVNSARLMLNRLGNSRGLASTVTCQRSSGAAVSCASGPVRKAIINPNSSLVAAAYYTVVANPTSSGIVDMQGNPARNSNAAALFRAT